MHNTNGRFYELQGASVGHADANITCARGVQAIAPIR